jgi:hypothetical protein
MKTEIQKIFDTLRYKVDHRREPDEHRFKKFHKGWQDSISNKDKSYTVNTLTKLTWQNLGYRFGKHFGAQTPEYIREVFDYLAQRYETDAKSIVWSPVSGEDRLLQRYWKSVGGRIYVEVLIGGPGGPGDWPPGCTTRRIDGVRLDVNHGEPGIFFFTGNQRHFRVDLKQSRSVEIIEVKASLNRPVIGQVLAGIDMFEREYGVEGKPVVVCGKNDTALEWVCKKRNIKVVVEKNK